MHDADKEMSGNQQIVKSWKTWERCVIIKENSVVKRELSEQELVRRSNGDVLQPFWAKERLRNEAATIRYVGSNTKIPVPECNLYVKDGLLHLETKKITNGVLLEDIDKVLQPAALSAVEEQMQSAILPDLRSLRQNHIGSVDKSLPVFPPQRVYDRDRRNWEQICTEADSFVLCHNDLGPQNIFVCPNTFEIVGIIDWEFAGFFPSYFELPLWRVFNRAHLQEMYENALSQELDFFGLTPADLQDCIPPP